MTSAISPETGDQRNNIKPNGTSNGSGSGKEGALMPPKTVVNRALGNDLHSDSHKSSLPPKGGVGMTLTDTPVSTAPPSPQISGLYYPPGTPGRVRATTLDIPGLTKSKVSPDGRIAQRDVGAKLVIVMVGLPARGKSYITKKLARYLNWLQHDTEIFNVGQRRRVAAGKSPSPVPLDRGQERRPSTFHKDLVDSVRRLSVSVGTTLKSSDVSPPENEAPLPPPVVPTKILVNGEDPDQSSQNGSTVVPSIDAGPAQSRENEEAVNEASPEPMDQTASFFDPQNQRAVKMREQVALDTLDELLDYILDEGGSIGILDATNSTMERRKAIVDHIRNRAGPELNILFLESSCMDQDLLEANMRLKLSGPDYKGQDPTEALEDFKKRVALYEKSYVPLGEYEEKHRMAFIQMIDVGRKVVAHQTHGFLASQVVYYLLNFNLSPRQIWITRHGESLDDAAGRIGGDSDLSENGRRYAKALARFVDHQRQQWEAYQRQKDLLKHFPPRAGDITPPNPSYLPQEGPRNFCVWSSMMQRSVQTAEYFNEDDYDIKQMRMLDEIHSGKMEGMTYKEIQEQYPEEYAHRKRDKLFYRYPGPGGESYLDIINRSRTVIVEVERTTDHVLLVGHRSVARVLLAYFRGLKRDEVADLDVPMGVLYMLEPKPYGVEFKAYRYNPETDWFDYLPDYELHQVKAQTTH
ncbi:Bifunctional 6-phosphofructo-2-kinase/fructose-2, 6-bisphosphate 2-phosphatase [Penicillium expansum]|uniref:Bifunctional 6-phosphofructo-2-kinase/fructose-2, 6-bisphosphate 2-phosphatase n=1 Tax=Penicillium expansum TaxID=27334 RepID=A0A0A2KTM0_PENEN|nr:Bifunctional 6-phosphofructo-2-kinase/fructose-2, 6-bisphosphate 2-phosphatase [Penicillium expansum]KGO36667.1 Bifunctional 6-phosphofructo-2-kinase/fructose-2, 6-bisphosphate 2-phosphatase [Penicillium expansum]KGO60378.1 Bifunctional 6-phosphofructo-2-kinase/fructose-2, 6-bisphosphate 2-phosphatase [Penicillium expansum]KGO71124.1 Bifunctional 6-phosphofructo-2-kinase/fructose-2, 6-bisphosphate 2-phosphatase [Penicillium expansum]